MWRQAIDFVRCPGQNYKMACVSIRDVYVSHHFHFDQPHDG